MRTTLSLQEGLKIQAENLEKWKAILIPEVYEHLERYCVDNNNMLTSESDGYSVVRGGSLDNVIGNYMLGWRFVNGKMDYENNVNK